MTWSPDLGAWKVEGGIKFRVWAPKAKSIKLVFETPETAPASRLLEPTEEGYHVAICPDVRAGDLYRFQIDQGASFPDPASRFQPQGVHGPSQVVDPDSFQWSDSSWSGLDIENLVIYEIHAGTFSPEGTFTGILEKLKYLKELGITAIELMPIGDFPGNRNWGYDGVDLFAPARCYGTPDNLRQLINAAHEMELGVLLDVVYNHLGPEGAYLGQFSPYYFSSKHKCPWGDAVNLDDKYSEHVRDFFIENALHWIHEYHIDGLRLDATHAMIDDSPEHFLRELADRVREFLPKDRKALIIAEDDRNQSRLVQPVEKGGYGLDGVWADDFHHQVRSMLAGDTDGYYQDFSGSAGDLATTMRQGWFYTGQYSVYRKKPRGDHPNGIPHQRFVHCIQNHDQIGNRAMGDRLNSKISLASYRAATALLLLSPSTPLLFMGQEWAATTPFCFFTDHPESLGKQVTRGRRNEFKHFKGFNHPHSLKNIPDPQAPATFLSSKLDWEELTTEPHAGMVRLYRTLLWFRRTEPALNDTNESAVSINIIGEKTIALERRRKDHSSILVLACLQGSDMAKVVLPPTVETSEEKNRPIVFSSEDSNFSESPLPPRIMRKKNSLSIDFTGPCAIAFRL